MDDIIYLCSLTENKFFFCFLIIEEPVDLEFEEDTTTSSSSSSTETKGEESSQQKFKLEGLHQYFEEEHCGSYPKVTSMNASFLCLYLYLTYHGENPTKGN